MIQDISPKIFSNQYSQKPKAAGNGHIMFVHGHQVLTKVQNGEIIPPKISEIIPYTFQTVYLFSIEEIPFYLALPGQLSAEHMIEYLIEVEGYHWQMFSGSGRYSPQWYYFAYSLAIHLNLWYFNNQFCGCCGNPFRLKCDERAIYCPCCGNTVYPIISPAVIVGVIHEDKILMTKYADKRDGIRYSLIAGFAEIGEAIEDTVRREVMEEVGIRVRNIRYYKSQPWPFSSSLLLGFFCDLDGQETITLDGVELSEAEWIHRDNMEIENDNISLTYEMMAYFRENRAFFSKL